MPANLTILITTSYYWPEDAGSAPYPTGLAEHLAEHGHDVLVATTFQHYPEWRSSAPGRLGATETHHGVQIRRRCNYVARRQSAFHRAGYEISLLGFGLTALPWRRRPDLVIGTSPSLAGSVLAATTARRHRVSYGLVARWVMIRPAPATPSFPSWSHGSRWNPRQRFSRM
jgi:colanic acid biosynthesis glycosyl transferase WcaI